MPSGSPAVRGGGRAYVMDEVDVRLRCRAYRAALPGPGMGYRFTP